MEGTSIVCIQTRSYGYRLPLGFCPCSWSVHFPLELCNAISAIISKKWINNLLHHIRAGWGGDQIEPRRAKKKFSSQVWKKRVATIAGQFEFQARFQVGAYGRRALEVHPYLILNNSLNPHCHILIICSPACYNQHAVKQTWPYK